MGIFKSTVGDIPELAEILQVSTVTIRRWITSGLLPHHRIGKLIRFTELDIESFLKANAASSRGGKI
jgi:excisionase family DNA binding protein